MIMAKNNVAPKAPAELFARQPGNVTKASSEDGIFPLGEFSKFVSREQPALLALIRESGGSPDAMVKRQEETLRGIGTIEVDALLRNDAYPGRFFAKVALLDLSFAISAAIFSRATPSPEVQKLNRDLAAALGLPEMMTFEKIISINSGLPFGQMRTFTDGDVGETEKRFYYGHDLMDSRLRDTTLAVAQAVGLLKENDPDAVRAAISLLISGSESISEFAKFMRSFMEMPREHFGVFRRYLMQYPDKTRNASGAFIGMPSLHIRLDGLSPRYEQFLDEGMPYFPVDERPDIEAARAMAREGIYIVAQCESLVGEQRMELASAAKSLITQIKDFRLTHIAAVNRHAPEALPEGLVGLKRSLSETEEEPILDDGKDGAKGTGGFLSGPLLRNCLRMDIRAVERLEAVLGGDFR